MFKKKKCDLIIHGFIFLFVLAFLFRMICINVFRRQYEPKIKLEKGYYFSFGEFLLNSPKTNFGRFTIFRTFLGFASAVSSPLLVVYLLRDLKFNYLTYMIVIFSGTFFSLLVMGLWGKIADRYGNYKVLCITSVTIPLVPILWVLHVSPIYLVFVPALVSGISWAGFDLASANFIYDNVSPQKRGLVISYFNMIVGIGVFFGAGLGALLVEYLPEITMQPIALIFLFGGVLRMLVVFFGINHFYETQKKEKFDGKKALKNILFKETKITLFEGAHEIMSIKKYLHSK